MEINDSCLEKDRREGVWKNPAVHTHYDHNLALLFSALPSHQEQKTAFFTT